jgi:hypothetical protein
MSYTVSLSFLNTFAFNYILDLTYVSEIIFIFYILATLSEEFIDYDSVELNY